MVPGDVYLVTNQDLMRGYDYRCIDGIALLIGKQLDSERARDQALGRVGRYGDDKFIRVVETSYKDEIVD